MNYIHNTKLRTEMSNWLSSQPWDIFTTYNFAEHFNFNSANRAIVRHYKRMCKKFRVQYPFFYVVEPHSDYSRSGTHVHGLIGPPVGDIQLSGKRMQGDWEKHQGHGFIDVRKYIEDNGVDYYLTKYLVKSNFDNSYWDFYNLY